MAESNFSEQLLQELRCHYCKFYLSCGPVRCSSAGEYVCGRCMPNEDTLNRSLLYEKVAEAMKFPCSYDEFGCAELLAFGRSVEHESKCYFKPITCPSLTDCNWKGLLKDVYKHYRSHDLILYENIIDLDLSSDTECNSMIMQNGLPLLIQHKYVAAEENLYFNAVYFFDGEVNVLCKLTLGVNGVEDDDKVSVNLKRFKCHPYASRQLDLVAGQNIHLKDYLPALQYPDIIEVNITFTFDGDLPLPASNNAILEKLVCSKCQVQLIPPIFKRNRKYYCTWCADYKKTDTTMIEIAKTLQYTCRWKDCDFKTNYLKIRKHEFGCSQAALKCCLGCDRYFNRSDFIKHLNSNHKSVEGPTVNLNETKCCFHRYENNLLVFVFYQMLDKWYVKRVDVFTDSLALKVTCTLVHDNYCTSSMRKVVYDPRIRIGDNRFHFCSCNKILKLNCTYAA